MVLQFLLDVFLNWCVLFCTFLIEVAEYFQTHLTFHNCGGSSCSYFEGIQLTKRGLVSISL